eukprot:gene14036-16591_t
MCAEALADAGFIVVTTPFNLTFDHRACALRVADSLTRGLKTLEINPDGSQESAKDDADEGFQTLPLYAMGHSNGALLQLLMSSLEECQDLATVHVQRAVLLSYNNKPVSEAVPGGVPPQAGAAISQLLDLGNNVDSFISSLPIQNLVPSPPSDRLTQSVLPLVEQLQPAFNE